MVVAASAVRGQAGERRHGLRHLVVAILVVERDRRRAESAEVECAGPEESESRSQACVVRVEHVRGQLFADESRPGRVAVEGDDHVVAVGPSVGPPDIVFIAMALGEVDCVEPVPRPPLAEAWRGQKPVDPAVDGVGRLVRDELGDRLGRRRKSEQVEVQPTQQFTAAGGRGDR